jgi:carbon storage regulator
MLVLSRKVNEQIVIGNNIRMTVLSIRGNQVRIGFEAPLSVPVFRDELRHEHWPPNVSRRRCDGTSPTGRLLFSDCDQRGLVPPVRPRAAPAKTSGVA